MMDKENHNLDRDFIADYGVPFICFSCHEPFVSLEYFSQHSEICHGFQQDGTMENESVIKYSKDFTGHQHHHTHQSSNSLFDFHNLDSSSEALTTDLSLQRNEVLPLTSSYSLFPLDFQESLQVALHSPPLHHTEQLPHVAMHLSDALLSSTTEKTRLISQQPSSPLSITTQAAPERETLCEVNVPSLETIPCPDYEVYSNQWFLSQPCPKLPDSGSVVNAKNFEKKPIACPHCKQNYVNQFSLDQHLSNCTSAENNNDVGDISHVLHHSVASGCSQDSFLQVSNDETMNKWPVPNSGVDIFRVSESNPLASNDFQERATFQSNEVSNCGDSAPFFHVCEDCGKSFTLKSNLKSHVRIHTGEKPFDCEACGQKFSLKSNLKKHYRTHTQEKPYQCTVCGVSFSLKSGLKVHLRTHTGEKPFECTECGQRFSSNGNLRKHLIIHTGEKPFSCKVCGRRFPQAEALRVHAAAHTGEKTFQCPLCDGAFTHKTGLDAHFRTHTGEKPFRCNFCDLTFSRKGGLSAHVRTHTGEKPFVCSHCGQAFAHKSNLNAHIRTHTGEKPFHCTDCDQKFAHKSNLKKHLKTHEDGTFISLPSCSLSDLPEVCDAKYFDLLDLLENSSTNALLET